MSCRPVGIHVQCSLDSRSPDGATRDHTRHKMTVEMVDGVPGISLGTTNVVIDGQER